jgi:hypothetical protein
MTQPPQSSDPGENPQQTGQTPPQKRVWPIVLARRLRLHHRDGVDHHLAGVQGEPAPTVTVTESAELAEPPFTEEGVPTEPTEEPSPDDAGPIKFGQTFTWRTA